MPNTRKRCPDCERLAGTSDGYLRGQLKYLNALARAVEQRGDRLEIELYDAQQAFEQSSLRVRELYNANRELRARLKEFQDARASMRREPQPQRIDQIRRSA